MIFIFAYTHDFSWCVKTNYYLHHPIPPVFLPRWILADDEPGRLGGCLPVLLQLPIFWSHWECRRSMKYVATYEKTINLVDKWVGKYTIITWILCFFSSFVSSVFLCIWPTSYVRIIYVLFKVTSYENSLASSRPSWDHWIGPIHGKEFVRLLEALGGREVSALYRRMVVGALIGPTKSRLSV